MKNKKVYIRDGRAPIPAKELTSKLMSANKAKNSKPELLFRKALWSAGIKGYRLHLNQLPGRPDIAFPSRKLAVFVHGCFWHRCPLCDPSQPKTNAEFWNEKFSKNIERDKRKINELELLGWKTLTVWECEIKSSLSELVRKLKNNFL